MLWTMLGVGRTEVCMRFSNVAHPIELSFLRRLSQYRHAFST